MQKRWYQDEAVESIYAYFMAHKGNPIVVMPTGTGKSVVIGKFAHRALNEYPLTRIMVLTHVKELISQNSQRMREIWPHAPIGVYSAGLKQRDLAHPILFGGIQSVAKRIEIFGHRDLLLIDECHLLSPETDTLYFKAIEGLRKINPWLKIVGFTATWWRSGQGELTKGGLFTDICYNIADMNGWRRLIAEGYLVPPIPKRTETFLDVSNVGMQNGEFAQHQLEVAVNHQKENVEVCQELIKFGQERGCWLIFAAGISHAENLAAILNHYGISAATMHSKLSDEENDRRLSAWKCGQIRAIVSMNKLTTGIDNPAIDLIGCVRPTMSSGLWVQMLGRGTRPCPEINKRNCLVLDFARNTERLGPINDPYIPKKKIKDDEPGDMPVKICVNCGVYNHARARFCDGCGHEFVAQLDITKEASTQELIRSELPIVEYFNVITVIYNLHQKPGSPNSIRVSYNCGMRRFDEWVCLEHPGFASKRARDWWRQRHWTEPPKTTADALKIVSELRMPMRIRVWVNKKPAEVLSYEY